MRIPPEEMAKTLAEVNKYLSVAESATRQANKLMREMWERHAPKLRVVKGGKQ